MSKKVEKDTSLFYLKSPGTIKASVESLDYRLKHARSEGLFRFLIEKRQINKISKLINRGLRNYGLKYNFFSSHRERKCLFQIERTGFFTGLKNIVDENYPKCSHLSNICSWNSIYLPLSFEESFIIKIRENEYISTGSSIELSKELKIIEKDAVKIPMEQSKLASYFQITEQDFMQYEEDQNRDDLWITFSFKILEKLSMLSLESGLPIIIN